eukprot:UN03819
MLKIIQTVAFLLLKTRQECQNFSGGLHHPQTTFSKNISRAPTTTGEGVSWVGKYGNLMIIFKVCRCL